MENIFYQATLNLIGQRIYINFSIKLLFIIKMFATKFRAVLLIITILGACNSPKENKILQEAAKVHNQAMKLHEEVMPKIDELKKSLKNLEIQDDTLIKDRDYELIGKNRRLQSKIEENLQTMQEWMKNIVEVQGNEHHHHSEGEHHHDHSPKIEVNDEEMLEIQKECLSNIQLIQKNTNDLLAKYKIIIRN